MITCTTPLTLGYAAPQCGLLSPFRPKNSRSGLRRSQKTKGTTGNEHPNHTFDHWVRRTPVRLLLPFRS